MDLRWNNPDAHGPWNELPDVLREAVQEVRQTPVPTDAQERALARARQLAAPPSSSWPTRPLWVIAAGVVAASVVLGLVLRFGAHPPGGYQAKNPADGGDAPTVSASPRREGSFDPEHTLFQGRPAGPMDVLAIGQPDLDRLRALRALAVGMPVVDRKGVEDYLRHRASWLPGGPVVWHRDARRPGDVRVRDADGQSLRLLGVYLQVVVEGPRARTLVDHVFTNQNTRPVSGTFEYTLPDGASPSYFTLFPGHQAAPPPAERRPHRPLPLPPVVLDPEPFVDRIDPCCWGTPRRASVVRVHREASPATEPNVRRGATEDPSGNGFQGPIGQVPPGAFIRVVLAYEEVLPIRNGRVQYRYLLPASGNPEGSIKLQADVSGVRQAVFTPRDTHCQDLDSQVLFERTWRRGEAPAEVRLDMTPIDETVQTTSGRAGGSGPRHLFARIRPRLPENAPAGGFARHAVFLLDTSAGEHARRFDRSVRLLRAVLENDPDIEHFNVLTFSTYPAWLSPTGWLANTKAGRDAALASLDGLLLEGATDLGAALERLAEPGWHIGATTPVSCFLLSDGRPTWGETDVGGLAARFEARCRFPVRWHCYQTGLGEENAELFAGLTRRGGGVYRCTRDSEVAAASVAHRTPCLIIRRLTFAGGPKPLDVQVAGRKAAVHPGGELLVAARFDRGGQTQLVLEGELGGQKVVQKFPLEIEDEGRLAARGWAELAVASLLSAGDPDLEAPAVALARHFRIPSRVTAFSLGNAGAAPEPGEMRDLDARLTRAAAARAAAAPDLQRRRLQALLLGAVGAAAARDELTTLLGLLKDEDLSLPAAPLAGSLPLREAMASDYLLARHNEPGGARPFLNEAVRRSRAGDLAGSLRALSSLLEQGRDSAQVSRRIGYRLVAMNRAALAAQALQAARDPAGQRALALSLALAGRPFRSALHYETALAQLGARGGWSAAVGAEYAALLRQVLRDRRLGSPLHRHFRSRLDKIEGDRGPADLRVTATWNTSRAVVGLALVGPDGSRSTGGGTAQGLRRVELRTAPSGTYEVELSLREAEAGLPETCVFVEVVRHAGSPGEQSQRHAILLWRRGERVRLARVKHDSPATAQRR